MRTLCLLLAVATILWDVTPVRATTVTMRYSNGSLLAEAALDVEGSEVVEGKGRISGGGLVGELPMIYLHLSATVAPLAITPAAGCVTGEMGCYDVGTFSCDCAFVNEDDAFDIGKAVPIDASGIAFQVGGPVLNYGLALYDSGDGSVGAILVGDQSPQPLILNTGTPGGTLDYSVVPEPTTLNLLCAGLFGLALLALRSKKTSTVR